MLERGADMQRAETVECEVSGNDRSVVEDSWLYIQSPVGLLLDNTLLCHAFPVVPSNKYWSTLLGALRLCCNWKEWSSSLPMVLADDSTVGQFSLLTWWKINVLIYLLFFFGNFHMGQRGHPTWCVQVPAHGREWKCISGRTGRAGKPFFLVALLLNWLNPIVKLHFLAQSIIVHF